MSTEGRLRSALKDAGVGAAPTPTKWDAVRSRASRLGAVRRRQRLAVAGLSTAAIVVAALVLFLSRPGDDRTDITDEPSTAGPAYVVTAEDGAVLVRSAKDGSVARVLAENADSGNAEKVAVSLDGSQVYFTRQKQLDCPGGADLGSEIVRVPIAGGPLEVVVENGSNPSVSPSGAYLVYTTNGSANGCGGEHHLMRRTIGVPESDTTISAASSDGSALVPMSWSKDESVLLAEGLPPTDMRRELFTIEGLPDDPRVTKVRFPDQAADALEGPAALLGPRLVAAPVEIDRQWFVVSFDPKTGEIQEWLFEVAKRPEYLEADASGQHFLVGAEAEMGYTLYRWDAKRGLKSLGDRKLRDMAWALGPTKAPDHFVAVTKDGDLQIRATTSGETVRTVATDIDIRYGPPTLATSLDGRYVYLDRAEAASGCDGPIALTRRIDRVDLSSGERESVADGAEPAISSDGSKLAYATFSGRCGYQDALVVRNLLNGEEERWTAPPKVSVRSPRWSADGRMLSAMLDGESASRLVQVDTAEPASRSLAEADQIPVRRAVMPSGFLGNDEFIGLDTSEDSTQVVTFDHDGARRRLLGTIWGIADPLAAVPSSDSNHLLVLLAEYGADVGTAGSVNEGERALNIVSVGGLETRMVASDVLAATWLDSLVGSQKKVRPSADVSPST